MEVEGHGKRPPQSVRVDVSVSLVELAFNFANECDRLRQYAGSGGWRGGNCPAMTLFGGFEATESTAPIVIGKVGEMAMCLLAGVPVDLALRRRGDGGKDLKLPCGSVQVKTSRRPQQMRLAKEPLEDVVWFAFCSWSGDSPAVSVDGYVSRAVLMRFPSRPSPRGSWINKEIPTASLLPIRQLLKIRPICEVL